MTTSKAGIIIIPIIQIRKLRSNQELTLSNGRMEYTMARGRGQILI